MVDRNGNEQLLRGHECPHCGESDKLFVYPDWAWELYDDHIQPPAHAQPLHIHPDTQVWCPKCGLTDSWSGFDYRQRENARPQLVLLHSDEPGEDGPYTIGAVFLAADADLDVFAQHVCEIRERLIESQSDYEDNDLLDALDREGYWIANPPAVVTVRP